MEGERLTQLRLVYQKNRCVSTLNICVNNFCFLDGGTRS